MQSRFSFLEKIVPAFIVLTVLLLLHPLYLFLVRNIAYLALVSNFQGAQEGIPCNMGSENSAPRDSDIGEVSYALRTMDSTPAKWLSFRSSYLNGKLDTESLNFLQKNDQAKALTLAPAHIQTLVDICIASGDIASAENIITQSDALGLAAPTLLEKLVDLYTTGNQSQEAIETYRRLAILNPGRTAHYDIKIGEIYLSTGELEKAENSFNHALAHGKEFNSWKEDFEEMYANFSLGEIYRQRGLKNEAVYYYDIVSLSDHGPWLGYAAWVRLGEYQDAEGIYTQAVESYLKAINCNPKPPWPHVSLGIIYGKLGDKAKAVEQYKIAESLDPTSIDLDKALTDLENLP